MKISKKVLSSFDIDIFKIGNCFSFILFHDCVYSKIEGLGFGEWTFEFLMIFATFINECFSVFISFVKYAESALFYLNICFPPRLKLNKKKFFSFSSNRLIVSIIISLALYKSLLSIFFSLGPCVFLCSNKYSDIHHFRFYGVCTSPSFYCWRYICKFQNSLSHFLASELIVCSNDISNAAS